MHIDIITIFPHIIEHFFTYSITQRAQKKGIVSIKVHNLRDYADNKHRKVDDYPYGGGSGMVMMIQPFAACIEHLQRERSYSEIIFLTPDGMLLNQGIVNELSTKENMLLLCGHYKGIDQRIRDVYVNREISIGDYVLSGGELPACILVDALVRLVPGVLSDISSALSDSFQDGLLGTPVYTRPANWQGHRVPPVLLSGNRLDIATWHFEIALTHTKKRRPELL